jgi:hypothetical protein
MEDVTVVFTNGNVVQFRAEEFDANLVDTLGPGLVTKFPYKDAEGNDSAVHLMPNEVAGIFITPSRGTRRDESIKYSVSGPR